MTNDVIIRNDSNYLIIVIDRQIYIDLSITVNLYLSNYIH